MSKHEAVVPVDRLADHPAVRAWRAVEGGAGPSSVEIVKPEKRRCAVFRLNGVGAAGTSVIAKRRKRGELDLERRLYDEVLPSLPVPTLRGLGFLDEADRSWIFLEDAGERWYEPRTLEHRGLAVRWLAELHTGSADFTASVPDTGPAYFRTVLDAGLDGLRLGLVHAELSDADRAVLRSVALSLERVGEHWTDVEASCAATPRGVVHGDFVPKNVRARQGPTGLELIAFDWETAGVASPATDLGLLPEDGESLRQYHALVSGVWPEVGWEDVRRSARVGRLLRLLNCVHWEARSFLYPWIEHTMRRMRAYERALGEIEDPSAWLAG